MSIKNKNKLPETLPNKNTLPEALIKTSSTQQHTVFISFLLFALFTFGIPTKSNAQITQEELYGPAYMKQGNNFHTKIVIPGFSDYYDIRCRIFVRDSVAYLHLFTAEPVRIYANENYLTHISGPEPNAIDPGEESFISLDNIPLIDILNGDVIFHFYAFNPETEQRQIIESSILTPPIPG